MPTSGIGAVGCTRIMPMITRSHSPSARVSRCAGGAAPWFTEASIEVVNPAYMNAGGRQWSYVWALAARAFDAGIRHAPAIHQDRGSVHGGADSDSVQRIRFGQQSPIPHPGRDVIHPAGFRLHQPFIAGLSLIHIS